MTMPINIAEGWRRVKAGDKVDGLTVRQAVPNISSIDATLSSYRSLGLRAVPMSIFNVKPGEPKLAAAIQASRELNPLIVVVDGHPDGMAYILEGSHRIDALKMLGVNEFPALVVVDEDELGTEATIKLASIDLPDKYINEDAKRAASGTAEEAADYAFIDLQGRWAGPYKEQAESTIAEDSFQANEYARLCIHGRWDGPSKDKAEASIARHGMDAYEYAVTILKHRWDGPSKELAERTIAESSNDALLYAEDVLGHRWDGPSRDIAEQQILRDRENRASYIKFLREDDFQGYADLMRELHEKGEVEAKETKLAFTKESMMSKELRFASEDQALQHLASLTGKRVMVAAKGWVEMSEELRDLEQKVCDVDLDFYNGTASEVSLGGNYDDTVADIVSLLSGEPATYGVFYCNHEGDRAVFYPKMTPKEIENELKKEVKRLKIEE